LTDRSHVRTGVWRLGDRRCAQAPPARSPSNGRLRPTTCHRFPVIARSGTSRSPSPSAPLPSVGRVAVAEPVAVAVDRASFDQRAPLETAAVRPPALRSTRTCRLAIRYLLHHATRFGVHWNRYRVLSGGKRAAGRPLWAESRNYETGARMDAPHTSDEVDDPARVVRPANALRRGSLRVGHKPARNGHQATSAGGASVPETDMPCIAAPFSQRLPRRQPGSTQGGAATLTFRR
jgi:hypothetical protein